MTIQFGPLQSMSRHVSELEAELFHLRGRLVHDVALVKGEAAYLRQQLEAEKKARAEAEAALEKAKWERDVLHDRLLELEGGE